jgi:hypothetical protein
MVFTFTLDGNPTNGVDLSFTFGTLAVNGIPAAGCGSDYNPALVSYSSTAATGSTPFSCSGGGSVPGGIVRLMGGNRAVDVTVPTISDGVSEGLEQIQVTITSVTGGGIGTPNTAIGYVSDKPVGALSLGGTCGLVVSGGKRIIAGLAQEKSIQV